MSAPGRVIIIGGGIGGLCLAQGLRRAGIDVAVHERDQAVGSRWEGYRIHVNPVGARALHACLPEAGWREFLATTGPGGDFGFLTEQMEELVVVEESVMYPDGADPAENHYAADRATLRRLLLTGLEDVVQFGAEFVGYEQRPDGTVEASFADGRTVVGDVLVGADGAGSRVRRQYLPHIRTVDAGAVGVAHKLWLTDEVRAALPSRLGTGMNIVNVNAPCFLFTSVFEPPDGSSPPYLLCALVARPDLLPPDVTELDSDALRAVVDVLVAGWHPQLRRALAESDHGSRSAIAFRTAEPGEPWPATPVTVMGDAIHLMPPVGGLGGNTALRDAHLLSRLLAAAARGERDTVSAIGAYESDMREYGTATVRYVLAQKEQALSRGVLATAGARGWFRLCAAVPALRRRSLGSSFAGPATARAWERV
ncbi:FAD-dependent oxidoreductase [Pseudonocardia xinjiangensis]|uniref:FAD-dependent oxidoreductase n=1 Tax=Pseudonocardia xinjiangensis TaxID=75289 RepID=UPI003D8BB664